MNTFFCLFNRMGEINPILITEVITLNQFADVCTFSMLTKCLICVSLYRRMIHLETSVLRNATSYVGKL